MQQKADAWSFATVMLSGVGFIQWLNGWAAELMPLITAFGILSGAGLTWWYYRGILRQRRRENDIKADEQRRRWGGSDEN